VRRTVTRGRAAPAVACGEEEVGEARNAPRFLEQQRGGQGITGADESTMNSHGGTVHRGGEQLENTVVSVGLNGEGVAWGHGGGHPPRSGSSAERLVWCGGRSARARVGGYGGEEINVCVRLKRVQNQTTRGGHCGRRHVEAGGARGPASRLLHGSGGDRCRSGGVWHRARAGERAACVGCA
jgi:hypothetical protein